MKKIKLFLVFRNLSISFSCLISKSTISATFNEIIKLLIDEKKSRTKSKS